MRNAREAVTDEVLSFPGEALVVAGSGHLEEAGASLPPHMGS